MRRAGFVDTVDGLGRHDHVCWAFDSPAEFRSVARRFLADALADGQRVLFVADAVDDADLDGLAGDTPGAVRTQDIGAYGRRPEVDPEAQVEAYARATAEALADGYTGLRVAADVTSMVRTPAARAGFARYEFLIDAHMTRQPFSAMCGYHRVELGVAAVAELAGMHPLARPGSTPMRLFASERPGVAAALAGEIDMAGHAQLADALARADLGDAGGTVTIDARELSFIDHRGLIQLVGHVRDRGARTVLQVGEPSALGRMADLLDLSDLRVVVA